MREHRLHAWGSGRYLQWGRGLSNADKLRPLSGFSNRRSHASLRDSECGIEAEAIGQGCSDKSAQ